VTPPVAAVAVPAQRSSSHGSPRGALAAAVLAAASQEPVDATLQQITQAAVEHVGATYGAIGVLAPDGRAFDRFVVVGMGEEDRERIGRLPTGRGILRLLVDQPTALRLDDLGAHPAAVGFPAGHPPMRSFLGVPIRVGETFFGNLYLTEKRTGGTFTDADCDAAQALAAVAGLAIENARLAERAELRRAWVQAGTKAATALLSGDDPIVVLHDVTGEAAALTGGDLTGLLVPTTDDDRTLTVAAAVGPGAEDFEGVRIPLAATHVGRVYRSGAATLVPDVGVDPVVGGHASISLEIPQDYEAAIMAPMGRNPPLGMIVALRARGRPPFDPTLLELLDDYAGRTAVALALATTQARERRLQVQADRDRIARDLHDHVVQRIFATALSLDRLSRSLEDSQPEAAERLARNVDELDSTIAEIRAAIFELHQEEELRPASLRALLSDVVRQVTEGHPLRRDVRLRGSVDDLSADYLPDLLAVARELVTNVVRHAAASRVTVTLTVDDEVRLVVTDDGVGLPPGAERSGLANLADRAERRGGRLSTVSRAAGTQVRWSVPQS
jgi:signal transduction histidine kinase